MATDNACNFYLFKTKVSIISAVFTDNRANNALFSVFTYSTLILTDLLVDSLTTLAGGLNLANSIDALISNVTFIDYCSQYGPGIFLTSVSSNRLEIRNIFFHNSENNNKQCNNSKILGLWESSANMTDFLATNITGNGLFDIRFNSLISFKFIEIQNNTCVSTDKGCFFLIDSNSVVSISNIKISQSNTFNSLIFVQNSRCNIKELQVNLTKMDSLSLDQYLLIIISSDFFLINFEIVSIEANFLSAVASNLTIQLGILNNSDIGFLTNIGLCLIFLDQTLKSQIFNITIQRFGIYDYGVF